MFETSEAIEFLGRGEITVFLLETELLFSDCNYLIQTAISFLIQFIAYFSVNKSSESRGYEKIEIALLVGLSIPLSFPPLSSKRVFQNRQKRISALSST